MHLHRSCASRYLCIGLAVVGVQFAVTPAANAIIIRHDVADAEYVVPNAEYPAIVDLIAQGDCIGTLVHESYLLTVAHCATDLTVGASLDVNGVAHSVAEVILHPSWQDRDEFDIAMVRFDAPVTGVVPIQLYRGADELGSVVTIVGRGVTATGLVGEAGAQEDARLRRATNVVTAVNEQFIEIVFERDQEAGITELEGVGAAGDSGCPVFIEVGGERYLAGLNSYGDEANASSVGAYGSRDYQTRVSRFLDWLDGIVGTWPSDRGELTVSLAPFSALESAGRLASAGTVRVANAPTADLTITLSSNLIGHLDLSPNPLTILAGSTSASFDITPEDDPPGAPNSNRTARITATAADHDSGSAQFEIIDDESGDTTPVVTWVETTSSVSEGTAIVEVRASLSTLPTTPVIVPFTIGGTAEIGADFHIAGIEAELKFVDGLEASVSIVLVDDEEVELPETVTLTFGTPSGATVGGAATYELTIQDDDDEPTMPETKTMTMTMTKTTEPGGCTCSASERSIPTANWTWAALPLLLWRRAQRKMRAKAS